MHQRLPNVSECFGECFWGWFKADDVLVLWLWNYIVVLCRYVYFWIQSFTVFLHIFFSRYITTMLRMPQHNVPDGWDVQITQYEAVDVLPQLLVCLDKKWGIHPYNPEMNRHMHAVCVRTLTHTTTGTLGASGSFLMHFQGASLSDSCGGLLTPGSPMWLWLS